MTPTPSSTSHPSHLLDLSKDLGEIFTLITPPDMKDAVNALMLKITDSLCAASDANVRQASLISDLQSRVVSLENQLKSAKKESYNSQIVSTKDNILVRTTKDAKAVCEFVAQTVAKAGSSKPPASAFTANLISTSSDQAKPPFAKGPLSQIPAPKSPPTCLYKVYMGPLYKDLIFKGLASVTTRSAANSDFSVSHDTPVFLRKNRVILEQCAFSIRKGLKEKLGIRTKVCLKDQNLKLYYNTKDSRTWVLADSKSATGDVHQQVQSTTYLAVKESDQAGTKSVLDVIAALSIY